MVFASRRRASGVLVRVAGLLSVDTRTRRMDLDGTGRTLLGESGVQPAPHRSKKLGRIVPRWPRRKGIHYRRKMRLVSIQVAYNSERRSRIRVRGSSRVVLRSLGIATNSCRAAIWTRTLRNWTGVHFSTSVRSRVAQAFRSWAKS